jgi:hypothetical protein
MENIFTAAEPFLVFGQIIGFFPKSFCGPAREGVFAVKWYNVLTSTCLFSLLIFNVVINIQTQAFTPVIHSLLEYGWVSATIFEVNMQLCVYLVQLARSKNFFLLLQELHAADEKVSQSDPNEAHFIKFSFFSLNFLLINCRTVGIFRWESLHSSYCPPLL